MNFSDVIKRAHRRVFRHSWIPIYEFAHEIILNGLGVGNDVSLLRTGEVDFLRRNFAGKAGLQIVDVGARLGHYSREARRLAVNSNVLALEANPKAFVELEKTARSFGFQALNSALSNEEGRKVIYDDSSKSTGSWLSSFHLDNFPRETPLTTFEVETRRLDKLLPELGIGSVDLLKVDVEGHEFEVLEGAEQYLEAGKIKWVQFEIDEINFVRGISLEKFAQLLPKFTLSRILPDGHLLPLANRKIGDREIYRFQNIVGCFNPSL